MHEILTTLLERLGRGESLAAATIVTQEGSTPRTAGSKMLVGKRGLLAGSVGGGLLEARSVDAAARALLTGQATAMDFDLSGEPDAEADMICGGRLRVFVEPLTPADLPFFEALARAVKEGRSVCTATRLGAASREAGMLSGGVTRQLLDGENGDPVLRQAAQGLRAAITVEMPDGLWFVEPWLVPPRLVLAGGGHVSQATAAVAVVAGFEVTVLDDRPEFASRARFPMAACVRVVPEFYRCFDGITMDNNTYVVILTRGHAHDAVALEQALTTEAGYIGMIGSVSKRDALYAALRRKGCSEAALGRVHCPVGLPIAAETPGEIAISIVAECVAHRRKKAGIPSRQDSRAR